MATLRYTHTIRSSAYGLIQLKIYADETQVDTANNRSYITTSMTISSPGSYSASALSAGLTGATERGSSYYSQSGSEHTILSGGFWVSHNTDGSGSTTVGFWLSTTWGTSIGYTSFDITLTKIPRYFTSTPSASLKSQSLNTCVLNWSTSENCSEITTNIGTITATTGLGGKSGTVTISGLEYDKTHSIKLTCKRSDSGLTSTANAVSVTTPHQPTIEWSYSNIQETSLDIVWSSDSTISKAWCTIDNGNSWIECDTSGTLAITGLNAGVTYDLGIKVQASNDVPNQLIQTVSTIAYPYAIVSDISIGDLVSVSLFNPLARNVTVSLVAEEVMLSKTYSTTGTNVSGWSDETSVAEICKTIPNTFSGKYHIVVTYDSISSKSSDATFTLNEDILPVINSVDIQEMNEKIPSYYSFAVLRYLSTKKVVVDAEGFNGSVIKNVSITFSDSTKVATVESDKWIATYGNCSNGKYSVAITDSRGRSATTTGELEYYQYEYPSVSIIASRESETGTKGEAVIEGKYWLSGLANTCKAYFDRASVATSLITGEGFYPLLTLNPSKEIYPHYYADGDSICSGGNIKYTKEYSGTGSDDNKLLYNKSYIFTVRVVDNFGQEATSTFTLGLGHPTVFFGKDVVHIYNDVTVHGELNVDGKTLLDWIYPVGSVIEFYSDEFNPNDIYSYSEWSSLGSNKWKRVE